MLNIHHLRNATLIIETEKDIILVDPMLGKAGSGLPFTLFRFKPRRNPLVELPKSSKAILDKVTHCLITHLHPDHLDKDAEEFLKAKKTPVTCSTKDAKTLKKRGLNITQTLDYWQAQDFLTGTITGIPAIHGYGFIAKPMGNVIGFHIELLDQKSIYISADTVYTEHVDKVLTELKPDIAIVACGTAQLDIGQPLLMKMDDIITFAEKAPKYVFANHMEALNHCPTTRVELKTALQKNNLLEKVFIPEDGEMVTID